MFKDYIKKNFKLTLLGSIIFIQLLLILLCYLVSQNAHTQYETLKSQSQSSTEWNFWNWIWRSGELIATYGNISRLTGYQNNSDSLIKQLLGVTSSTTASSGSATNPTLTNAFYSFNSSIQICTATICIIGILAAVNAVVLSKLVWEYTLKARKQDFRNLLLVLLFNIFGLPIAYRLEQKKEPDKKIEWLLNIPWIKEVLQLKNDSNAFEIHEEDIETILEVKNLNFYVENKKKIKEQILKNINCIIKKNSLNVVIGPNGSGKTTLIKSIINIHEDFTGEVLWGGKNIKDIHRTEFARQVSYIPQFLNLQNPIEITDFLEIFRYPYKKLSRNNPSIDKQVVLEAMDKNNCQKFKNKMINELSGGQKQKILLTSVLTQESKVIVLDEPTSFLDIKNQYQFLEILKEFKNQGKTIIMILHDLQQAIDYADNLIVIQSGEIKASGSPRDIVTPELLQDVFNINCTIETTDEKMKINNIYAI